eukprot:gnl/MRDRNA2_/MRDRNA2_190772_c0_seq1.p1 gnl/MRDRNA2_/MRDRNA2_190772_c0~~gnl/MRDRNA2_/MRDRNA2_190772_c0_seq1.p1  ORF type:complete len:193 (+),score=27.69 gnl/MRDRNA2_/MRDRNA2_190772_c0_seq1:122-700(+)
MPRRHQAHDIGQNYLCWPDANSDNTEELLEPSRKRAGSVGSDGVWTSEAWRSCDTSNLQYCLQGESAQTIGIQGEAFVWKPGRVIMQGVAEENSTELDGPENMLMVLHSNGALGLYGKMDDLTNGKPPRRAWWIKQISAKVVDGVFLEIYDKKFGSVSRICVGSDAHVWQDTISHHSIEVSQIFGSRVGDEP